MKGIIIYENDLRRIDAVKLKNASFCYESIEDDKTDTLQGTPVICASTICNKEDTYDFEVGALIALMKMCKFDKSYKAIEEAFKYNSYEAKKSNEYEEKIDTLEKENNHLKYIKSCNESVIESLENTRDLLIEKNNEIITDREKTWKIYQNALQIIQEKQDRINELEEENKNLKKRINELEIYNNQLEDRVAAEQRGGYKFLKDMEKLQHEYDLCKNSENALKCSVDYLNKTIAKLNTSIYGYKEDLNKATKRCEELEIKESTLNKQQEQLDKREEKLSVYFGGRGNGKQYKALVELFKKIPKDKVQAAYVAAYKESLIWCTSQSSIRDQLDSLIEGSKYAIPYTTEWIKPPTKREEMWNDILACDCEHSKYVKVKKEDLETFAKECNEKKIFSVIGYEFNPQSYWSDDNSYIFQIFRKPAGFICAKMVSFVFKDTIVDYLPPMRWDLFKKGRLVVKVDTDNYEDFYNKCEVEIGRKPKNMYTGAFTVYYKYEKELEQYIFHTRPYSDTIPYAKKIVYWEDVR